MRRVFAGGKQACKTENGGRTHTSTCLHFARGLLFRNGTVRRRWRRRRWRRSAGDISPFSLRSSQDRGRVRKKTPKRTKMNVATPSPLRAPASCGSFRKNRRPRRFPFKSASHGGSFTSFTTKPYTGWRTRRLRFRSKR